MGSVTDRIYGDLLAASPTDAFRKAPGYRPSARSPSSSA